MRTLLWSCLLAVLCVILSLLNRQKDYVTSGYDVVRIDTTHAKDTVIVTYYYIDKRCIK